MMYAIKFVTMQAIPPFLIIMYNAYHLRYTEGEGKPHTPPS